MAADHDVDMSTIAYARPVGASSVEPFDADLFIAGQWVGTDARLEVYSPHDRSRVGSVAMARRAHAIEAIESGRRYADLPLDESARAELLERWAEAMDEAAEPLARQLTLENGKPIRNSRIELRRAATTARVYAGAARELNARAYETIDNLCAQPDAVRRAALGSEGHVPVIVHRPLGVVTAFTPFNFPANTVVHKVAAAIAAGNAIILKPSEKTPLSALALAGLFSECDAPAGVLSVLSGHHEELTEPFTTHPSVDFFTMTGHSVVGRNLYRRFAEAHPMKFSHFELGGNAPQLVLEDYDPIDAAEILTEGVFDHNGSRCTTPRKILVPEGPWASRFLAAAVEMTRHWPTGDPLQDSTRIGPLIDESAAIAVENRVQDAILQGARCLVGGKRDGAVIEATVLTDVRPEMRIFEEENFGPVMSVIPYRSVDEAIEVANLGDYGLQPAVMTTDPALGWNVARCLRGGCINVGRTATSFRSDTVPFGGVGSSGIGKEGGLVGVQEMCQATPFKFHL